MNDSHKYIDTNEHWKLHLLPSVFLDICVSSAFALDRISASDTSPRRASARSPCHREAFISPFISRRRDGLFHFPTPPTFPNPSDPPPSLHTVRKPPDFTTPTQPSTQTASSAPLPRPAAPSAHPTPNTNCPRPRCRIPTRLYSHRALRYGYSRCRRRV